MQSNVAFTGVIPVKVLLEGKPVNNTKIVHKTCNEVVKILSGPLCDTPQFKPAAAQLATADSDYNFFRAFYGYASKQSKTKPSDYFKIIMDQYNYGYLVTGKPVEIISELGKKIGKAKQECNQLKKADSPKLIEAKNNYWKCIHKIKDSIGLRIRETFDPATLTKHGKFQQMNINISLKPIKHNTDNKIIIESINFSDN